MEDITINFVVSLNGAVIPYRKEHYRNFINDCKGTHDECFDSESFRIGKLIEFQGKSYKIKDIRIDFDSLSLDHRTNKTVRFPTPLIEVIILI
jgi:hypothetical protein